MPKVTPVSPKMQRNERHSVVVAKSALLSAGAFVTGIATILMVAGEWGIDDVTVMYALTVVGVIAAIAQGTAVVYVVRRGR